jgi:hypothetical protein
MGMVGAKVIELTGKIGGDGKGELLPILVRVQYIVGDMLGTGIPIAPSNHKGMTTRDIRRDKLIDRSLF